MAGFILTDPRIENVVDAVNVVVVNMVIPDFMADAPVSNVVSEIPRVFEDLHELRLDLRKAQWPSVFRYRLRRGEKLEGTLVRVCVLVYADEPHWSDPFVFHC